MRRLVKTKQLEISWKLNHQKILWKYHLKEHKKNKGSLFTWRITCSFLDYPLHATPCFIVIRKQFCAMNQKENLLQYLTEKIVVSMEIFILPRKILNIMLKKLPNLSLHMLINVILLKKNMYIKQFCGFA